MLSTIPNSTDTTLLDFSAEIDPGAVGMHTEGVRRLGAVFERQIGEGLHPAAQLVVLRRGQVVFDRALGMADTARQIPVTPDTPFLTFSITKALTAMCIHRLIEEGHVELDAAVARYWPEFGCRGKETATIRHVLVHKAGIPGMGWAFYAQIPYWPSWRRVTRNVARAQAEYPPGSQTAYHSMNYGFILGEVVRRVIGQPIEAYLRETFLAPLGLNNTYLGLSRKLRRSLRPRLAGLYALDSSTRNAARLFNLGRIRGAVLPAVSLHSTARDLAVFYQMLLNGGIYGGRRYVQPETIAEATALGNQEYDIRLGMHIRRANGFHLGGRGVDWRKDDAISAMGKGSTVRTYGCFGMASCMVWGDPQAEVVLAFTCNGLCSSGNSRARWVALSNAVWDALE